MSTPRSPDPKRYRANWQEEIDSAARYRAMAEAEQEPGRARVYQELAEMEERHASINDLPIKESDRKYHWDRNGPRPTDHLTLTDLGL